MMERQPKILLVEDEPSMRRALSDKFTREGFVVFEAKNGEEGLDVALHDHPDIILLDMMMPRMDGPAVVEKLRQDDTYGKNVPVLILSNLGVDSFMAQRIAHYMGTENYLVKADLSLEEIVIRTRAELAK